MMSRSRELEVSNQAQLDLVFRALGNRTRRQMLEKLAQGPANIGQLAQPFDMSLPAVGKHLKVLESSGLVRRQVDGRVHLCSLDPASLQCADQWLDQYRKFWDETLESLSSYFEGN